MSTRHDQTMHDRAAGRDPTPVEDEARIGVKLRHTRILKGLTMKQLATKVGCSESLLSKIENGRANPSLNMIQRLARSLDTTVGELFMQVDDPTHVVARAGERPMVETDQARRGKGLTLERLIPHADGHLLQGHIHHIAAGGGSEGTMEHEGEEFGYVLAGELELTVDGHTYVLGAGDSFCFRSERPHSYRNIGAEPALVLWLNTPPSF